MQNLQVPKLHLLRLRNKPFYLLQEGEEKESAIVFCHGLGENRTGINYLFRDLSRGLQTSHSVYRFDLAGCGDSTLPLDLSLWEEQLAQIQRELSIKHKTIHLVARGLSSFLLPQEGIAINPPIADFVLEQIDQIPLEFHSTAWAPLGNRSIDEKEEVFWYLLGVEAGCLGGFRLNPTSLKQLNQKTLSTSSCKTLYCGQILNTLGKGHNLSPHILLKEAHPFFLFQKDRLTLCIQIKELLNE